MFQGSSCRCAGCVPVEAQQTAACCVVMCGKVPYSGAAQRLALWKQLAASCVKCCVCVGSPSHRPTGSTPSPLPHASVRRSAAAEAAALGVVVCPVLAAHPIRA